jgi:uncharacterized protein YbaP (TraB family)
MIYRIRGTNVYLIGTIHLVPNGAILPIGPQRLIVEQAAEVVFESDLDHPPVPDCHVLENGSLSDLLGRDLFERVRFLAESAGFEQPLDRLKPWYVGMMLGIHLPLSSGATLVGVDRQLWDHAIACGKAKFVLEGVEFFRAVDQAPVAETVAALDYLASNPNEPTKQLDAIFQAWRRADLKALDTAFALTARMMPTIYRVLFRDRNRMWIGSLLKAIQLQRRCAFVVGCGHIAHGDYSLEKLLHGNGYLLEASETT